MPEQQKIHGPKVLQALEEQERLRSRTNKLGAMMLQADGGNIFPLDLLAIAAIKRSLSNTSAMRLLVENWNLVAARTILRAQLDTPVRFSAVWLVDDPHDFATKVHAGEHIRRMKDRSGNPMTDAYLIEKMSVEYPWIKTVYERLSGYVHFSANHVSATVTDHDDEARTVKFAMSAEDLEFPEESWVEVIACFNECTRILHRYLEGWTMTKGNPLAVSRF